METNYQIAPIGKRIVAYIIDSILSLLPLAIFKAGPNDIFNVLFFLPINPSLLLSFVTPNFRPTNIQATINIILFFVFLLYGTVVMIILKNKTIGMILMKVKVVKTNNSNLKVIDIIVRQFFGMVLIPSLTFGFSNIISFFWALFSKTNNTVQDKITGTLVVEDTKEKSMRK